MNASNQQYLLTHTWVRAMNVLCVHWAVLRLNDSSQKITCVCALCRLEPKRFEPNDSCIAWQLLI